MLKLFNYILDSPVRSLYSPDYLDANGSYIKRLAVANPQCLLLLNRWDLAKVYQYAISGQKHFLDMLVMSYFLLCGDDTG